MSKPTPDANVPIRRVDRILAFISLGLAIVAIGCFFAVILAAPLGVKDFTAGLWPLILVFPLIALPISFILIVVLLIMTFVRRARANRGG
ncbi:multidrug ABC transporter ATPase [Microbacterium deminutum]|uniref:Multidrug ABC transporter ATPase n=1 Tax=Microbacterium deminutum TaxID=344164 RepID=A0ABP5CNN9_9MICO